MNYKKIISRKSNRLKNIPDISLSGIVDKNGECFARASSLKVFLYFLKVFSPSQEIARFFNGYNVKH